MTFFLVSFNLIIRSVKPNQTKTNQTKPNQRTKLGMQMERERESESTHIESYIFIYVIFYCYFVLVEHFDPHEFQMHVCGLIPEPIRWYVAAPILRESPATIVRLSPSSSPSFSFSLFAANFFITCVYTVHRMSFTIFSVLANSGYAFA